MRGRGRWTVGVTLLVALAVIGSPIAATRGHARQAAKKPIIIGAAIDLKGQMAPFDAPALTAAQIQIKKLNAHGGVLGHKFVLKFIDDQLDPTKTKQAALTLLSQGASIIWVTCDVDYASPAAQAGLNAKKLTIAPCIGTDEMSPLRFGPKGKLAFSFGNAAQDEGAAMAEYSEVESQANDAQAEDDGSHGLSVHGTDSRVRASQSRESSPVMRASSTRAEISA